MWISNYQNRNKEWRGYELIKSNGELNLKRFKATFDYSLDLIKLRDVYLKVYRNNRFSYIEETSNGNRKEYCNRIINVTFDYNVRAWNRTGNNIYMRLGTTLPDINWNGRVGYYNDEIVAIKTDVKFDPDIHTAEALDKICLDEFEKLSCFVYEDGIFKVKQNIKSMRNINEIRKDLYENGFYCDGIKYVRWKRSSGSARVGKCLFIDEKLYDKMHRWEMCGLKVKAGDKVDLAALESYISLTSSSIIDTLLIKPENILVIDDFESIFTDDAINVYEVGGKLEAKRDTVEISNSCFDGQSLIDISLMGKYRNKGMVLLRNRFFKSCCFNANIQKWFSDHNIKSVTQLNGFTSAKDISDIKLITTPSSIKYLKFSTLDKWLELLECNFGVVKYEKPPHFMDGKLVQTHYQLLNSLQLTRDDISELLSPTFSFMTLVKNEPAVLRHWIKFKIEYEPVISPLKSKTDVIYKMMSINDKFYKTKLYYDFRNDFLKSFTKDLNCGHVLVNGNYSTLCGNPIEMLMSSIGIFNGKSVVEHGCVYSTRFDWNKTLLGSRSPHPTISNVLLVQNRYNELIERYMNPTPEIVYINSIEENILQQLAGCDFDSDSVLLTDNSTLIKAAQRNYGKFKVAVCGVGGTKKSRYYNSEDKTDLDQKTSNNLIGDIINLAQELNTQIWQLIHNGCDANSNKVQDLYLQTCKLSIMSGIEIDKAKKEFVIDNSSELRIIRKYRDKILDGMSIKPHFFAHISKQKGFYNPNRKTYRKHDTAMDYLQQAVNKYRLSRINCSEQQIVPFSEIIDSEDFNYDFVYDNLVKKIITNTNKLSQQIKAIYSDASLTKKEQHILASEVRQETIDSIGRYTFTKDTMIVLLRAIEKKENSNIKRLLFYILFGYPNTSFYEVIINNKTQIPHLESDSNGEIEIYGEKFLKTYKKRACFSSK